MVYAAAADALAELLVTLNPSVGLDAPPRLTGMQTAKRQRHHDHGLTVSVTLRRHVRFRRFFPCPSAISTTRPEQTQM